MSGGRRHWRGSWLESGWFTPWVAMASIGGFKHALAVINMHPPIMSVTTKFICFDSDNKSCLFFPLQGLLNNEFWKRMALPGKTKRSESGVEFLFFFSVSDLFLFLFSPRVRLWSSLVVLVLACVRPVLGGLVGLVVISLFY